MNKKLILFFLGIFSSFTFVFANNVDPSCESYYDGCNHCSRSEIGGEMACTMMYCFRQDTPKCLKYFDGTKREDTKKEETKNCTKEYMPICAQPQMPKCEDGMMCIQVMPEKKTYSNKCMANIENAQIIYSGSCLLTNNEFKIESQLNDILSKVNENKKEKIINNAIVKIEKILNDNILNEKKYSLYNFIMYILKNY